MDNGGKKGDNKVAKITFKAQSVKKKHQEISKFIG